MAIAPGPAVFADSTEPPMAMIAETTEAQGVTIPDSLLSQAEQVG